MDLIVTGISQDALAAILDISIQDIKDCNISCPGFIDDISSLFQETLALVSPTFVGSGVRKKILQSMANYLPVIATTFDISTLECLRHDSNILGFSCRDEFLDCVTLLRRNSDKWSNIANKARQSVETSCSWAHFAESILSDINDVLAGDEP